MDDYYKVLGVSPLADFETIKKAYRQRGKQCHPDRGGTHAQMVLVNLAWQVLSDPSSRRRYDDARNSPRSETAQQATTDDVKHARNKAEQYPKKWADFEAWLNKIATDFTGAQHGSKPWSVAEIYQVPTVEDSVSGKAFIAVGMILGGVVSSCLLVLMLTSQISIPGIIIPLPIVVGAWLGAWLHRATGRVINTSRRESSRRQDGA